MAIKYYIYRALDSHPVPDYREIEVHVTVTRLATFPRLTGHPDTWMPGEDAEWVDDYDGELTPDEIREIQEEANNVDDPRIVR